MAFAQTNESTSFSTRILCTQNVPFHMKCGKESVCQWACWFDMLNE